jgi:NAD(P)-dependent dehydrogenase (short-subunit alcohol dehydrogenase family)
VTDNARIALITGANQGIGRYAAEQLAEAGLRVYLGARDATRGQATVDELRARDLDAHLIVLDVTDAATIDAARRTIEDTDGHLDVLVNNAGISTGFEGPTEVDLGAFRTTLETNLLGVVATTNAMLPLLRKSAGARIVNVSSGLGSIGRLQGQIVSGEGFTAIAYLTSKAALNALTVAYAKELYGSGFKVNVVNPGYRATNLGGGAPMPGAGDPADGARIVTAMALLDDDGPTGTFVNDDGSPIPW